MGWEACRSLVGQAPACHPYLKTRLRSVAQTFLSVGDGRREPALCLMGNR